MLFCHIYVRFALLVLFVFLEDFRGPAVGHAVLMHHNSIRRPLYSGFLELVQNFLKSAIYWETYFSRSSIYSFVSPIQYMYIIQCMSNCVCISSPFFRDVSELGILCVFMASHVNCFADLSSSKECGSCKSRTFLHTSSVHEPCISEIPSILK